MTPRQALASLLAVPYWTTAVLLAAVVAGTAAGGTGLRGWAETGAAVGIGVTIGLLTLAAQDRLLDAVAGWVWARVEILAAGWRELTGAIADIPLTSGNAPDIEMAGQ